MNNSKFTVLWICKLCFLQRCCVIRLHVFCRSNVMITVSFRGNIPTTRFKWILFLCCTTCFYYNLKLIKTLILSDLLNLLLSLAPALGNLWPWLIYGLVTLYVSVKLPFGDCVPAVLLAWHFCLLKLVFFLGLVRYFFKYLFKNWWAWYTQTCRPME